MSNVGIVKREGHGDDGYGAIENNTEYHHGQPAPWDQKFIPILYQGLTYRCQCIPRNASFSLDTRNFCNLPRQDGYHMAIHYFPFSPWTYSGPREHTRNTVTRQPLSTKLRGNLPLLSKVGYALPPERPDCSGHLAGLATRGNIDKWFSGEYAKGLKTPVFRRNGFQLPASIL